jgi:hypothetical protein
LAPSPVIQQFAWQKGSKDGKLHTIDNNDEIRDFALDYIRKSGYAGKDHYAYGRCTGK